jgi:hypothetical protein
MGRRTVPPQQKRCNLTDVPWELAGGIVELGPYLRQLSPPTLQTHGDRLSTTHQQLPLMKTQLGNKLLAKKAYFDARRYGKSGVVF